MPKLIFDEFTSQPISPQLRYQRRKKALGRCRLCGQPAPPSRQLCETHHQHSMVAYKGRLPFVPRNAKTTLDDDTHIPTQEEII